MYIVMGKCVWKYDEMEKSLAGKKGVLRNVTEHSCLKYYSRFFVYFYLFIIDIILF